MAGKLVPVFSKESQLFATCPQYMAAKILQSEWVKRKSQKEALMYFNIYSYAIISTTFYMLAESH